MARFLKMHGCGNDFVVFDERAGPLGLTPRRAAAIADRRTGVGCDQFIAIEPPPPDSNADAFMRIRNPDGAEAGACGNAPAAWSIYWRDDSSRVWQSLLR
jgi:diaminopimelate epimerase